MCLHVDFLPVFEGKSHIVLVVDGNKVHQTTPKASLKFVHQVSLRQGFQKGFNGGASGLLATDGLVQGFVSCLGSIEPCGQSIIAFLVFDLVEGNMSVFADALFDEVGNHRHFAFQFSLFRFEVGKVKCCVQRYRECRNNRIFLDYQLIDRRYEHRFDVILSQMRCCAFFVTIEFMITLPNYPAVFAVGIMHSYNLQNTQAV